MTSNRQPVISENTLNRVAEQAKLSPSYLLFMATSGVLAAVALLTNSIPILVGSMVIAPTLPPLKLISFSLTGLRPRLAMWGFVTAFSGLLLAMLFALVTTWLLNVTQVIPPETNLIDKPLLEERLNPGWFSVAAALAAGIAGTVALIKEKTDTLVGVVAALALVPAVAAASIALLSNTPLKALDGLTLLGINVGLIIVSGILTLVVIRPEQQD